MVTTTGGVQLFWGSGTPGKLSHSLIKGTSVLPTPTPVLASMNSNYGVSACRIGQPSDRLLGVAVVLGTAATASTAQLLVLNEADLSIAATKTLQTGNIKSSHVEITQNPRSGVITIGYISDNTASVSNFLYSAGTFVATTTPSIGGVWSESTLTGFGIEGYSNFETSFVGNDRDTPLLRDALLRSSSSMVSGTFGTPGIVSLFPYDRSGVLSACLVVRKSDYKNFELWTRPLNYPKLCTWDQSSSVLYLEGPPFPGTTVTVTASFPEPLIESSTASAVNALGGAQPFTAPTTRLIASAGAQFILAFTDPMMTASFPAWVGETAGKQIRMFGPGSTSVNIGYTTHTSRSVVCSLEETLAFDTLYYIQIASDVLNASGTQLWEPATFSIRTQLANSGILASEVLAIEAFRDAARTDLIPAGSDISATSTLYLRIRARDPAFNTIDFATATYIVDGTNLATLSFAQPSASTETFYTPATTTALAWGVPHTLRFQTASPTASVTFVVTFPTTLPLAPASGAAAVPVTSTITIQANEPLDPASVVATTARLLIGGVPVPATLSYDPATRVITITPAANLLSETLYTVEVGRIRDAAGNPQVATLSYTFTSADVTPPALLALSPASGSTGVTIDTRIALTFSEQLATPSVNPATVRLLRPDGTASYAVSLNGRVITIDPDDTPDGFLRTITTYTVALGAGVRDIAGNSFTSVPATFTATFQTQASSTPPLAVATFGLYRDAARTDPFTAAEAVSGTATVHLRLTGTDGATQTRDIADVVLRTTWGPAFTLPVLEIASDSTGIYHYSYILASIPVFDFAGTLPPSPVATISFIPVGNPAEEATLTVRFPVFVPAQTTVQTLSGSALASGASGVRLDSGVSLRFTLPLDPSTIDSGSIQLIASSGPIAATRTLSPDGQTLVITPSTRLTASSTYLVRAVYAATGLRGLDGNPLYRPFEFAFTTQPFQTPPLSVGNAALFSKSGYTPADRLVPEGDGPGSGTLYLEFQGIDGSNLTVDATLASLSTGGIATLTETGAATGIYRGSFSVSGLPDGYRLIAASTVSPAASATLVITYPKFVSVTPASGATDITIDNRIFITLTEPLDAASVTTNTVRLTRPDGQAMYTVGVTGSNIIIDPNDTPDGYLRTLTSYTVALGAGVRDLYGNPFISNLATWTSSFQTQLSSTPPSAVNTLTLYRDAARTDAYSAFESVFGKAPVFLKLTGTDGATQTRDIASVTLRTSWGPEFILPLLETASNSSGFYYYDYTLASIPVFDEVLTLPPAPVATISFLPPTGPAAGATLTVLFPAWLPAQTTVQTLVSAVPASGATGVRLDSGISLRFSSGLAATTVDEISLQLLGPSGAIPASRVTAPDGQTIQITPAAPLAAASTYRVKAASSLSGMRGVTGNPLYRGFEFAFTTQNAQTPPTAVSETLLFSLPGYDPFTRLATEADCPNTGTLYVEMRGTDGSPLTVDTVVASISTGVAATLTETGAATGIYRGSFAVAGLADGFRLIVAPSVSPAASATLVVTYPTLTVGLPASGATGISVQTTVAAQADEPLAPATIGTATVRLRTGTTLVPSSVSYASPERQVLLTPTAPLLYNTNYIIDISGLRDEAGNPLSAPLSWSFRTQDSTVPPTNLLTLDVFSDSGYSLLLASGSLVTPGSRLFIRITATDASPGTIDATGVRCSSNLNASPITISLVESAPASGMFLGSVPVFPEAGALLTIESLTAPALRRQFRTPTRPSITSLVPASGSSDLPFDTLFSIRTDKPVDGLTLTAATVRLSDLRGYLVASMALRSPTEILVEADLATDSGVSLEVTSGLADTDGMSFPATIASYATLTPSYGPLTVYADAGFTQVLPTESVVKPGDLLRVRLSATDTRTRSLESLAAAFSDGIATTGFPITEIAAGEYRGGFAVPAHPGATLTISLPIAPGLTERLHIQESFRVTLVDPADGAAAVPADVWPTWRFSRPLSAATTFDDTRFRLRKLPAGTLVSGNVYPSADQTVVEFLPDMFLDLSTAYQLEVDGGITDTTGAPLGTDFITGFVTQPPPPPPSTVRSIAHFRDAGFTTPWPGVIPGDALYLEVRADDISFSTVDSTRVRIDATDGSFVATAVMLLEETGPDTGIFRRVLPTTTAEGQTITVRSQADSNYRLDLPVFSRPKLAGISPASGSGNLWLDQPLRLTFTKPLEATLIASGGITVRTQAGTPIPLTIERSADGKTLTLSPSGQWATGTEHLVSLGLPLRDTDWVPIPETRFSFTTRSIAPPLLELFSGIASRAGTPVSAFHESLPGSIRATASATDLFGFRPETRHVRLQGATGTAGFDLTEIATAPGLFAGSGILPFARGSAATATLEFGARPSLGFVVAPLPRLLGLHPASGAASIAEAVVITASFSRPIDLSPAPTLALRVNGAASTGLLSTSGEFATEVQWIPDMALLPGARVEAVFPVLQDRLGQPLQVAPTVFSVVGIQGMILYTDPAFTRPLVGTLVSGPSVWIEVAASGPIIVPPASRLLQAYAQRNATMPYLLPLDQAEAASRRFRGRIDLEPARGISSVTIPVVPGERIDMFAPVLTGQTKYIYYRTTGNTPPVKIRRLSAFTDMHYRQPLEGGDLPQTTVYLEIEAEDLNWLHADSTDLSVTSDSDPAGFELTLRETAPHSGIFRAALSLNPRTGLSNGAGAVIAVRPGESIVLRSAADPGVVLRLRYQPLTRLDHLSVWPSPVRGDRVTFSFWLTTAASVDITIFDASGDEVWWLTHACRTGENRVTWNIPRRIANGAYLYRLELHPETDAPVKKRIFKGKFAILR
ncbi:MAG TPA: Ig-like domain-containing protein [Candidatus Ozemobacteraceae bacterium]